MNKLAMPAICAAAVLSATAAMASNELVLLSQDDALNSARVAMTGNDNRLVIMQEHTGGIGGNTITATINGDLNGGPLGAAFTGAARLSGLQPGRLSQVGFGNMMTVEVTGSSNLFAFAQTGSGNVLQASISGYGNQAAVIQTGMGNHAAFSQTGIGNIVSITQTSW